MCDVDAEGVVAAPDAPSIYDIPKVLHREGLDAYVVRRLGLPFRDVDWTVWGDLLDRVHQPERDGDRSRWSASTSTCPTPTCRSPRRCAPAGSPTAPGRDPLGARPTTARPRPARPPRSPGVDGVLIPGGFGVRGIEGKLGAIRHARDQRHPDARAVPGPAVHGHRGRPPPRRARAAPTPPSSTRATPHPVIATMADQRRRRRRRARHGRHDAAGRLPGRAAAGLGRRAAPTARREVTERHRHRYEVNNAYRDQLEEAGLVFSGTSPDGSLVEFVELPRRRAPVLRRHPGPPGAQEPPDPAASAVRGVRRGPRSTTGAADRLPVELAASARPSVGQGRRDRAETAPPRTSSRSSAPTTSTRAGHRAAQRHGRHARRRRPRPRGRGAPRRGRDRRAGRRRPGGDDPPVPAPGRPAAVGAAGRAARRRRRGPRWRPRSGSWPRRPGWPAPEWSLLVDVAPRPVSATRRVRVYLAEGSPTSSARTWRGRRGGRPRRIRRIALADAVRHGAGRHDRQRQPRSPGCSPRTRCGPAAARPAPSTRRGRTGRPGSPPGSPDDGRPRPRLAGGVVRGAGQSVAQMTCPRSAHDALANGSGLTACRVAFVSSDSGLVADHGGGGVADDVGAGCPPPACRWGTRWSGSCSHRSRLRSAR